MFGEGFSLNSALWLQYFQEWLNFALGPPSGPGGTTVGFLFHIIVVFVAITLLGKILQTVLSVSQILFGVGASPEVAFQASGGGGGGSAGGGAPTSIKGWQDLDDQQAQASGAFQDAWSKQVDFSDSSKFAIWYDEDGSTHSYGVGDAEGLESHHYSARHALDKALNHKSD